MSSWQLCWFLCCLGSCSTKTSSSVLATISIFVIIFFRVCSKSLSFWILSYNLNRTIVAAVEVITVFFIV